ncbi:AAA family ATPase [Demequina capsici]|uniref:AAA family ATPase n=1 Tax=Demequina capsici TaxID=3075620 RepID=A0AA96FBX7_9MICO|nr:AAA family ATPase [Demequina sp. OYTSA14]WNM25475.1 AAA family ATPase [Demequina sp. OYTSA14]
MLRFDDPLPRAPRRVLIAGVSGAGKSTLARSIAVTLDVPYTELDSLFHGPDWTPRARFLDDVRALVGADAWVTEWQYPSARQLLTERADLLIWLDQPFLTVTLPRVLRRTFVRRMRREQLWNGNTERPFHTFFTDPEHIVRWAWTTRNDYGERVASACADHPDLPVVRLRSPRQVDRWLAGPLADSVR